MADNNIVSVTFDFDTTSADDKTRDLVTRLQDMSKQSATAREKLKEIAQTAGRVGTESGKAGSSLTKDFQGAAEAIKASSKGAGGFEVALKRIQSIHILLFITAIITAIKSLLSYFTKTREGQQALAKVTGYLSGVMDVLSKVAVKLGELIYKAFMDPKKAVTELWKAIKENLVNRLEGLGEVFKSFGKIISSGFSDGYSDLANSLLKVSTGVDDFIGKAGKMAEATHKQAMATAELSMQETKLNQARSDWQVEDANLEAKVNALKREGASQQAIAAIEKQRYDKKIEFANAELDIAEKRAKLKGDDSLTDDINEKKAELVRLKSDRDDALSSKAKSGAAGSGSDNTLKAQQEYQKAWEDNQIEFSQKQIDLLDDSFTKQQKQNELNHKKALLDVARQEQELLQKKQEAYGKNATLSPEEQEYIQNLATAAEDEYAKAQKDLNDVIKEAYEEGRLRFADELSVQLADIDNYYKERIKQAEGNEDLIALYTENKQKEIALARIAYSKEMLENDLKVTKSEIANAQKRYKTQADLRQAELLAEKKALQEKLKLLKAEYEIKPSEDLAGQIQQVENAISGVNAELDNIPVEKVQELLGGFSKIASALGGLDGEIGSVFSQFSSSLDSIQGSFENAKGGAADYGSAIGTAVSNIVGIINLVTSAAQRRKQAEQDFYRNAIGMAHEYALALNETVRSQAQSNAFVKNYAGSIKDNYLAMSDAYSKYNEAIDKLGEGKAKTSLRNDVDWGATLKSTAMGAAAGAAIGSVVPVIGTAVGAVVGAVGGFVVGLFGGKKKSANKSGLLDVFPELVDSAGNLNKELAQSLIDTDQLDDKTKQLVQNALDWQDAIDAARENIKGIVEDLAGDLGNSIRTSVVSAWKAGGDAATAMFDAASDSLEDFVTKLLWSTLTSDIWNQFSDRLADSLDPLNGDQNVIDDYKWLTDQLGDANDDYIYYLNQLKTAANAAGFTKFGTNDTTEDTATTRTASAKGIQAVTQDSIDSVNGRLTALLIAFENTEISVGGINNQLVSGVALLTEIRDNTNYCRHLEAINNNVKTLKENVDTIKSRGVIIRA